VWQVTYDAVPVQHHLITVPKVIRLPAAQLHMPKMDPGQEGEAPTPPYPATEFHVLEQDVTILAAPKSVLL
jgi:hypothetical protein